MTGERWAIAFGLIAAGFIVIVAVSAFFAAIFWALWNYAAVSLGAPPLDFAHAWATWLLISVVGSVFRSVVTTRVEKKL
jgi:membrane protease YdiL (CAAX protease family)